MVALDDVVVAPEPQRLSDSRRILIAVMCLVAVAFVVVYLLAVHTALGQRLDASAVGGRKILSPHRVRVAARLHTWVDVASLTLLGGAIMFTALVRDRLRLALGAGVIIGASVVTAETLKHTLGRPYFGVNDALHRVPTFPSGHTAVAMSLAVAAVLVAPKRWRSIAGVLGATFATAVGGSMVATASHRPSDVIGSALIVTAWASVVGVALPRSERRGEADRSSLRILNPQMAIAGVALLVVSFGVAATTIVAIHFGRTESITFGREFFASVCAIAGTIFLCISLLLLALRNCDLDPPAHRNDQPRTNS